MGRVAFAQGPEGWVEDELAFCNRSLGSRPGRRHGPDPTLTERRMLSTCTETRWLRPSATSSLVKVPGAGIWMRDVEPAVLERLTSTDEAPFALPAGS